MSTLRTKILKYPGSYGLNTQEATLTDEETRFGFLVTNGVVDSAGKLASRQDFVNQTSAFSNTLQSIYSRRKRDGTEDIVSVAAGIWYTGTSTLTERFNSSNALAVNWQFATLGSNLIGVHAGVSPKVMNESYANVAFVGAPWSGSPNVVIAAYGRAWYADDAAGGNRYTIWWSNLLDGITMNAGDAGSINLTEAWPKGQDSVVALAAAFNKLIVFGRRSILLYTMAADNNPANMTLDDAIADLGCVSRDSVVETDQGIYFLSDNGIYRIDKFGQTTSLIASAHVSQLYNDDVLTAIAAETAANIKGGYYPTEGWYVLSFPTPNTTFCVHTRKNVPNVDKPVATKWTNTGRPFYAFTFDKDKNWYSAGVNGVHKYSGYTPDGASNAYTLTYTAQWLPFEDETRLKHAKTVTMVLEAASGQTGTLTWSVDYLAGTTRSESCTCSATEFAEDPGVGYVRVQIGGTFKVIRPSVAFTINGDKVTVHQMQLFANPGAVKQ
jgi:hypothetical protein